MPLVLEKEEEGTQTPICVHQDVTFVYIKYNNLYRILLHFCDQVLNKSNNDKAMTEEKYQRLLETKFTS